MPRKLGVNIDHVATIRQARLTSYPDPVEAAFLAESGGADLITVHLREDRRHIQDRDVKLLKQTIKSALNLEMGATQEMLGIAMDLKPHKVTLVPEKREELTTEGGLDIGLHQDKLKEFMAKLTDVQVEVSLFVDPDLDQIRSAHRIGAQSIELNTGRYCEARNEADRQVQLGNLQDAAKTATRLRMQVHAGHGLHLHNVRDVASIEDIQEFNIGHSIIARSIVVGMSEAVREMAVAIGR